jgi:hypothetical protein
MAIRGGPVTPRAKLKKIMGWPLEVVTTCMGKSINL